MRHSNMTLNCTRCRSQSTTGKRPTVGMFKSKLIGFKLHENGEFEEIFNGPGKVIYDHLLNRNRKGLGSKLLSLPTAKLRELSRMVQRNDRIPKREEL